MGKNKRENIAGRLFCNNSPFEETKNHSEWFLLIYFYIHCRGKNIIFLDWFLSFIV